MDSLDRYKHRVSSYLLSIPEPRAHDLKDESFEMSSSMFQRSLEQCIDHRLLAAGLPEVTYTNLFCDSLEGNVTLLAWVTRPREEVVEKTRH